ncbi:surface-adhesin E family protein [Brevundimonas sp.]|uniref:surface-adhesin E family protein n=1 Tax=Brevundimonas sp. TaxID=1871086 RepID=UPI002FC96220
MIAASLVASLAMFSTGPGQTGDPGQWRLSGHEGNFAVAYDVASIERSGSSVTVRSIFATGRSEMLPHGDEWYDYRISLNRFDCERRTGAQLHVEYYSLEHEYSVFQNAVPSRTRPLTDGSLEGLVMQYACGDIQPSHTLQTGHSFTNVVRRNWRLLS